MRVLLDENVDCTLKQLFDPSFEVVTVRERGWNGKANGELLRLAEVDFDVLVTMDKNIEHQQNLTRIELAIVVMRALSNTFEDVAALIPKVNKAVRAIQTGEVVTVSASSGR